MTVMYGIVKQEDPNILIVQVVNKYQPQFTHMVQTKLLSHIQFQYYRYIANKEYWARCQTWTYNVALKNTMYAIKCDAERRARRTADSALPYRKHRTSSFSVPYHLE